MAYPWFRVYSDIVRDPKMWRLNAAQRWYWIGLLALANDSPTRGVLEIAPGMPYTARDVALALGASSRQVEESLDLYRALHMIHTQDTAAGPLIVISHWASRQYEPATLRSLKHRRAGVDGETRGGGEGDTQAAGDAEKDASAGGDAWVERAQEQRGIDAQGDMLQHTGNAAETPVQHDRNTISAMEAGPDPEAYPEPDLPSGGREGMIHPSFSPSIPQSPAPQAAADADDAGRAHTQEADEGDGARRAADVEAARPDEVEPDDRAAEETGEADDAPAVDDPYEDDEGGADGAVDPPRHKSWRIEDKIVTYARQWAPAEEPDRFVHAVFKLWKKTCLDEERMYRAVNKALDVTRLRMDKGLIHSAGYMQYMLAVLRNEVLRERGHPPAGY
jgi:hypothetical protein